MKAYFVIVWLFLICCKPAMAQSNDRTKSFNLKNFSLAIQGYDPVAYFTKNQAVEGTKSYALTYKGITYYFSTLQHKELFEASPAQYEPQYGGWCAYAMGANGEKVLVDPKTFKMVNGKLYLFYNRLFNNTLDSWNKNEKTLQATADRNWEKHFKP